MPNTYGLRMNFALMQIAAGLSKQRQAGYWTMTSIKLDLS